MIDQKNNLEKVLSGVEKIGVIGSPSGTSQLTLDILGNAVNKKLVGELALFSFLQEGKPHYALGQITEIQLRNVWHEDPTIRSLIRQKGRVEAVSERQDTHLGQMTVSAVFSRESEEYEQSILGTVPATGTVVNLVNDEVLNTLLKRYKKEIFYLGKVYGSKPKLPLWFKHFDSDIMGAGEAYHLGIFGKTGSGKSVLAKMIMTAYARYPQMGIFVIDPQGEFSRDLRTDTSTGFFKLPLKTTLQKLNKEIILASIKDLVLDTWELFTEVLAESLFLERLTISRGEYSLNAAAILTERLRRKNISLSKVSTREVFEEVWTLLGDPDVQKGIYKSEPSRTRLQEIYANANKDEFYNEYWLPAARLFKVDRQNAVKVTSLIHKTLTLTNRKRPIVAIDLSREAAFRESKAEDSKVEVILWNETIQGLVIKRLLDGLTWMAESYYHEGRSLNTLIILDEAGRLASQEDPKNEQMIRVRNSLIDAVRTTRKYGLGWMFISQTISGIHKEIFNQLRIYFVGFGLSMGAEYRRLEEIADENSLKLYKMFRDPASAFHERAREYPFMTQGPVSPLSFAGTPLFFSAFTTPEEFLRENKLLK